MGQVIDFAAKKKELEDKKTKKQQLKDMPARPFSKTKEPPVQKQVVTEEQVEQKKTADDEFDFEKIMRENEIRKDKHSSRRLKDNESVKRSYRLKSKREPQG